MNTKSPSAFAESVLLVESDLELPVPADGTARLARLLVCTLECDWAILCRIANHDFRTWSYS